MNKLKEKWASLFIPKRSPYCHHKFESKGTRVYAKPCKYFAYKYNKEFKCEMQYCKLLKDFLYIQDQVKDCSINEDYE